MFQENLSKIVLATSETQARPFKAAVSGADGFIGSHLHRVLQGQGLEVAPIEQGLLYLPDSLRQWFQREQPDYIFHLAAYGNMAHQKEAVKIFAANLSCTFNMLNESLAVPYRAFINVGTSSEYGRKGSPMSEKDLLEPETFYAATKAGATHLASAFARQCQKPIVTVRPFSAYGPGEADFRFIPTVIRSMLTGAVFPLDENANHDWIYVEDLAEAIFHVAQSARDLSWNDRVVNVGSGTMSSNWQVCETLKELSGLAYRAQAIPGLRSNDSGVWISDCARMFSLGFSPRYDLKAGLSETFHYFKARHEVHP